MRDGLSHAMMERAAVQVPSRATQLHLISFTIYGKAEFLSMFFNKCPSLVLYDPLTRCCEAKFNQKLLHLWLCASLEEVRRPFLPHSISLRLV